MNKQKLLEWAKSLLIVVLVFTTIILLKQTNYYNTAFERISSFFLSTRDVIQSGGVTENHNENKIVISPRAVSVSIGPGYRYASVYNSESVTEDYQRFSAALGEALGSSGEKQELQRSDWYEALAGECVYIEFFSPQPFSALAHALGTEMTSGAGFDLADKLCMSCDGNSVKLYYISSDGGYYRCDTAVSAEAIRSRIVEFIPNGAAFSHEISALYGLQGNMLVPGELPDILSLSYDGSPSSSQLKALLFTVLDINEYTVSEYVETSGTTVYLDGSCTLHLYAGGRAMYSYDETNYDRVDDPLDAALNQSWDIISGSILNESGDADIYLSEIQQNSDTGDLILSFDYSFNCIPIHVGNSEHAAVFKFKNGVLKAAEFNFRRYMAGEESIEVLPVLQAAAISAANSGSSIGLAYSHAGDIIDCIWVPQ